MDSCPLSPLHDADDDDGLLCYNADSCPTDADDDDVCGNHESCDSRRRE